MFFDTATAQVGVVTPYMAQATPMITVATGGLAKVGKSCWNAFRLWRMMTCCFQDFQQTGDLYEFITCSPRMNDYIVAKGYLSRLSLCP